MKKLLTLTDKDIFPGIDTRHDYSNYAPREAVKMILFDEKNKLALVGVRYRLLPGGGVENNETLIEAAQRECLEEVGCHANIKTEIGYTEEHRDKLGRYQKTYFLLADVVGEKGLPQSTQEDEQGIQTDWYSLEEAILLLEKQTKEIPLESYHSQFNVRTHLAALREYQKIIAS
jgi:8-oxo-dGTP pyrophosphatase MutT (NUDIX family)